MKDNTRPES